MTSPVTGVDCHAHVIDPDRYAFVPGRGYQPRAGETGPRDEYFRTIRGHGLSHGVLVQPSCYAFDNRAMVDALAASDGRCKGIAVVPAGVDDATLAALESAGVVGARLNLGAFDAEFFERPDAAPFLRKLAGRGWLVQVYANAAKWPRIAPMLLDSGATVIVDHLGEPDAGDSVAQPGFAAVLDLGRRGRAFVKLAAPYRMSREPPPHADLTPFVRAALDAFGPQRCIWGSDWPFLNAGKAVAYADQSAWLVHAVPDPHERRRILVENPVSLYGLAIPVAGHPS